MAALFRMERSITSARVEQAGRLAVESILTVTVGVLIGRLAWVVLAPADAAIPAPGLVAISSGDAAASPAPAAFLVHKNLFAATPAGSDQPVSTETALDLKLAGVRAVNGNAAASSAVIAYPDGNQKRLVPGDEVLPGVLLVNVTSDSVHLSRSGILETLSLNASRGSLFAPAAEPMPSAPQQSVSLENVTPASVVADTILTPEFRSGQVSGYRMAPRGNGAFEAAGLETGDLILRVNGEAIEGLRPEQISQSVARSPDVSLDVVRHGAIIRLRVAPGASLSQ